MYDLIILGGGPGGYRAAELAARNGLKVAIIENNKIGGTCLNEGCIPFKSYLHKSRIFHEFNQLKDKGIFNLSNVTYDFESIYKEKERIIPLIQNGILLSLRKLRIDFFNENGFIQKVSKNIVEISLEEGHILEGKNLLIATGSIENNNYIKNNIKRYAYTILFSNSILELKTLPRNLLIIGGGSIGIESACFFNELGCNVTLIESTSNIGGRTDKFIADNLKEILEKKGIHIELNTSLYELQYNSILLKKNKEIIKYSCDSLLLALGRTPNLTGFNIEQSNIDYNNTGIIIDEHCRTNLKNVYACGDVTGKIMLAHTAYIQAKTVVDNILKKNTVINYNVIPRIIYSNPEMLSIGFTEEECNNQGINTITAYLPMTYSGKYFVEHGRDNAKAKIIFGEEDRRIKGFFMIGNGACEIALSIELMIINEMTIEQIRNIIFPHPTVGEIISELLNYIT